MNSLVTTFDADAAFLDSSEWNFRFKRTPFIDADDADFERSGDGEGVGMVACVHVTGET